MKHAPLWAAHSGTIQDLCTDYLPAQFVSWVIRYRGLIGLMIVLLPVAVLVFVSRTNRNRSPFIPALGLALAALLLAIPFHNFFDEVFIGLKHAKHLAEAGRFSFDPEVNVDGCIALAFYFLVAGLHSMGVHAPFAALILSGVFFAGTIFLMYVLAHRETSNHIIAWLVALFAATTPSFSQLAGTAWSSTLVGFLAVSMILLWSTSHWRWTFVLIALLPFVRYDFAFYTVILGAGLVVLSWNQRERSRTSLIAWSGACLLTIPVVAVFWLLYYGHLVPTPFLMKAGHFNLDMVAMSEGAWRFAGELLPLFLVVVIGLPSWRPKEGAVPFLFVVAGVIHYIAVLAAGGEYVQFNRYFTFLVIGMLACAINTCRTPVSRLSLTFRGFRSRLRRLALPLVFAGVVVCILTSNRVVGRIHQGLRHCKAGTMNTRAWFGQGIDGMNRSRLNNHALTGRFFSRLTKKRPATKLATLEVASVFYFFDGVSVDVLGFVNREVAHHSRRSSPIPGKDIRKPDLEVWARERPEIIWLDTKFMVQRPVVRPHGGTPGSIMRGFLSWSRHSYWTKHYLDIPYILDHYAGRLTSVNHSYHILWLVRKDVAHEFDGKLESLGFDAVVTIGA